MPGSDARSDATAVAAAPRFSDIRHLAEVTSTNDVVAALARDGLGDGVVVVADHQTAGRGRRGRSWEAARGTCLLVSVLVRPSVGESIPELVTLVAGLAVVDACASMAGVANTSEATGLKWPNDVMVDGRGKLAGLLCEVAGGAAVVGLGLNLSWPSSPEGDAMPTGACSLADLAGRPVDRDDVLAAWLAALERRLAQDPTALLDDYRRACVTIGRRVGVELPAETIEGTATGVDGGGRLVVDGRSIEAGDVVHLR